MSRGRERSPIGGNTHWAILTGEYPPNDGGVGDYTRLVARGLAAAGDRVTVFTPPARGSAPDDPGIHVVRLPDHFGPRGLPALDRGLGRLRPDRLLVQYVPHAYGLKGMNLPFVAWVAARAVRLAPVWVMFHEVAFPFSWRPLKYALLGTVTRVMAQLLATSAEASFVSILAWVNELHRIAPRAAAAEWLPVPSNVPTTASADAVAEVRARYAPDPGTRLIGHFGTYGALIADLLQPSLEDVLQADPAARALLIGRQSEQFRKKLISARPGLAGRVASSGELGPDAVPSHLRACDLLLQPYPDGVSSRRTSVMAGLANGVPVVSNLGALSEPLWGEAGCVGLAPSPDRTAIAAAAESLIRLTHSVRAEMGRGGAKLYASNFSLTRVVDRLRDRRGVA